MPTPRFLPPGPLASATDLGHAGRYHLRRMMWPQAWTRRMAGIALPLIVFSYLAYIYCGAYFPLDPAKVGGPGDFEPYSALDWLVAKTLREYRELPLWNPYVHSGVPFIGDPYISFFNPFVVLPFVIFGPVDGGKLAIVCAVALAGAGQYWLSRVLGQNRFVCVAAGVLGLASGNLVATAASGFSFGHTLQFGWMAPTLAAFIVALRQPRPGAIALAAACYALLFHAGNLYYWLVLTGVLVIIAAGYAVAFRAGSPPSVALDRRRVVAAISVAGIAFLLVAPQVLPMLDLRRYAEKPIDVAFRGTVPPLATLFHFVVPDLDYWKAEPFGAIGLGWSVYYSYLGGGLFLFLFLLVPAFLQRPDRALPLLLLGAALSLAWASARHTFMWEVWQRWDVMQQFRYWSTATGVTAVLLIPLGMAGADYLWRRLDAFGPTLDRIGPRLVWQASGPAGAAPHAWSLGLLQPLLWGALIVLLVGIVVDPWTLNRRLWHTRPYDFEGEAAFAWLRQHDPATYGVFANPLIYSFASVGQIRHDVHALDSVWPFRVRPARTPGLPGDGLLTPSPKYILTRRGASPPPPQATLLQEWKEVLIYTAGPGLPFAFIAAPDRLPYGSAGAAAVASGQVQEATARFDGPNRIVVQAPSGDLRDRDLLVVMQSWVRGWSARDSQGRPVPVRQVGGFLAIPDARSGELYVLSFLPTSFLIGSVLGLSGLVVTGWLVWLDVRRQTW